MFDCPLAVNVLVSDVAPCAVNVPVEVADVTIKPVNAVQYAAPLQFALGTPKDAGLADKETNKAKADKAKETHTNILSVFMILCVARRGGCPPQKTVSF